jgi:hypothetical protein
LKRQSTEWKKILASYTSDKGLITRVFRLLKKLYSLKINDPVEKWANELSRTFQRKKSKWPHEEMLNNIPDGKGNANQSHVKIPRYSC